jgi:hypothetical protein
VEDVRSGVAVAVALEAVNDVERARGDGFEVYAGALGPGADLLCRVHARGFEDFARLLRPVDRDRLTYRIDLTHVSGLRLVSNVLELLDAGGAPRLRVPPPYVIDRRGARHDATLALAGCAYDEDSRGPWGRAVTPPGSSTCELTVSWHVAAEAYPVLVDPAWTLTGALIEGRFGHQATALLDGRVLVTGGYSGTRTIKSAELFDPATGTWAATASMPDPCRFHEATLLRSGDVLVTGGQYVEVREDASGQPGQRFSRVSTAAIYVAAEGRWVLRQGLPGAVMGHTATVLPDGRVMVTGGGSPFADSPMPVSNVWFFDTESDDLVWHPGPPMAEARIMHTATLLADGRVLVVGGDAGGGLFHNILSSVDVFDPMTNAWSTVDGLHVARAHHTATLLQGGNGVLVVGGVAKGGDVLATAEIWDSSGSGVWGEPIQLVRPRWEHRASLLADGRVLISGTLGTWWAATNETVVEVYAPTTQDFSYAGDLVDIQFWHTMTVLPEGRVLAAGGGDGHETMATSQLLGTAFGGVCTSDDPNSCFNGYCVHGRCCPTTSSCSDQPNDDAPVDEEKSFLACAASTGSSRPGPLAPPVAALLALATRRRRKRGG